MSSSSDAVFVLGGSAVASALAGREEEVMEVVGRAYVTHEKGSSSLPHSIFLRFPGDDTNRIIGLPAFLGDGFDLAGMKWISSFPANVARGIARASAVMVLNSTDTGHAQVVMEGSLVSATRTAASAALAARTLLEGKAPEGIGLVGTGLINRETVRFLAAALPALDRLVLFDLDAERARSFGEAVRGMLAERGAGEPEIVVAGSLEEVLSGCELVAFATTAIRPHVADLAPCRPGAVILHTSLRDLTPEVILQVDNVVDDADHVCRASTSIHLAEQQTGNRDFIRAPLARILSGDEPARPRPERITVFSPFGLGVLDLAVGQLVVEAARSQGLGQEVPGFHATETL